MPFTADITHAQERDGQDELARFREQFVITDPMQIYMDGNSLGRLPKQSAKLLSDVVENEWGKRLIQSWNDGWINVPTELGAKIAKLVGAQLDEILVSEATSINLFNMAAAALRARPDRTTIVSDVFNFPSDLYILQGLIDFLGNKHKLELVPSHDTISIAADDLHAAIDDNTALVALSHVAFKSAFMYDMARVTKQVHQCGGLMLWDLSHSTGAVPVDLNGSDADLAVGCTYKYLNGGPGGPAFLYVRKDLQAQLHQPMWGWLAAEKPFNFDLEFTPAPDISRFEVGTPSILSMKAVEPGVDITLEATMEKLREKSVLQTDYLIYLADEWLAPLDFSIGSPRDADTRGSHVSLRHPEGFRITRALIESLPPALRVIPDFRAPDNIRFGITPLYMSFMDIYCAMKRLREIASDRIYEQFSNERSLVT